MMHIPFNKLIIAPLVFVSGLCLAEGGVSLNDSKSDLYEEFVVTKKHQTDLALELSKDWMRASQKPYINPDGRVIYAFGASMAELVCKPRMVCDIKLQEGEKVLSKPKSGDLVQWVISDSVSGEGVKKSHHVAVKPLVDGLSNNLMIYTNKRTYSISLKSSDLDYMPMIGFAYNDHSDQKIDVDAMKKDAIEKSNATVIDGNEVLGNNLDFNYSLSGDDVKWRPLRVFNDKKKTYIDVNKDVSSGELPSLLVTDFDTRGEIINYRYIPEDGRYIVDGVFDSAIMALGVGRKKKKVVINRRDTSHGVSDSIESALGLKGPF